MACSCDFQAHLHAECCCYASSQWNGSSSGVLALLYSAASHLRSSWADLRMPLRHTKTLCHSAWASIKSGNLGPLSCCMASSRQSNTVHEADRIFAIAPPNAAENFQRWELPRVASPVELQSCSWRLVLPTKGTCWELFTYSDFTQIFLGFYQDFTRML